MHRRDAIRRVAAAGATLALPAWAQSSRIVLGQSAAFSGPAAQLGIQMNKGARIFFDQLNASGGINGHTVELRTLDDGYEPERCKANTEKLIKDDVYALFGYIGTPTALAALPLANTAKVPFLAPFTGAQALRDPFSHYAFHVRASYWDETARIVNQLFTVGMKKIAVFYQNDSYGQAGLTGVTRALDKLNAKPIATGTVERNTVEVAASVKSIVAAQPEAIVQISAYRSCAAFIREARKAGFGGQFCNVSFVGTAALANELGRDARGVVISQVMPYPFAPVTALSGEFLQAIAASQSYVVEPNYSSIEGYVAAKVFAEGLKRAGSNPSRESLVTGLESMQETNLGGFFVDFNPKKHTGSTFVDMTILTQDGKVRR